MRTMRNVAGLTAAVMLTGTLLAAEKPFDPARDAAKDLDAAMARAKTEKKTILLDVGGNWCPWCLVLDRTLADDAELHALLENHFVVVHVNFSKENQNAAFLRPYPPAKGYPAWYVLSEDGKLLKAEDTSELEATHKLDAGYNKTALVQFLKAQAR